MKATFNENNQMVLTVNDTLTITLDNEASYEYRSHINDMQAIEPNNWVACEATGNDGKSYTAWYYVAEPNETELDEVDYENPDDITDEHDKIVYDKDAE